MPYQPLGAEKSERDGALRSGAAREGPNAAAKVRFLQLEYMRRLFCCCPTKREALLFDAAVSPVDVEVTVPVKSLASLKKTAIDAAIDAKPPKSPAVKSAAPAAMGMPKADSPPLTVYTEPVSGTKPITNGWDDLANKPIIVGDAPLAPRPDWLPKSG